jgi:hypothetical protein
MSLDATVHCDCFERGRLRSLPLPQWDVHVSDTGGRWAHTASLDEDLAFDQWNITACEHEDGVFLHHYLGNIERVRLVREGIFPYRDRLPIILGRIVYNGIHTGDLLTVEEVVVLRPELDVLAGIQPADERQRRCVRYFENQLKDLVAASLRLRKPISF